MRRRFVLVSVAVVLVALIAVAARWLIEPVEETVDRGYQGEAAVNPYLALETLYREIGVPARSVAGLPRLPPTDRAIVLATPQRGSGPAGAERFVDWAAAGGHLVVATPVEIWGADPLLESLGVYLFDEDAADDDDHLSRPAWASERPEWPKLYHDEYYEILEAEGAPDAAWRLDLRVGEGRVTVLSDGDFLANESLARSDHALIARDLLALDERSPEEVWIVFRNPSPSMTSLLGPRLWPLVTSLAALVLFGLALFARRRGPLLEATSRDRRHFAEHVRAIGSFSWNAGVEGSLLDACRETLHRRLGRGRGGESGLRETAPAAAAAVGLDEDELREALALRECRDPKRFTRIVRNLEILRRSP